MNKLGDNIIAEIQRNHIKQIKVHGVIGKLHSRNLMDASLLQIELGNCKVMGERIAADRWNPGQQDN